MRWKPKVRVDQPEWVAWFAIWPVTIQDGTRVWLEMVERSDKYWGMD